MKLHIIMLAVCAAMTAGANELPYLHSPLNIPLTLSGNFGELRPNHFHSGLDFKTNGRTGYKIYCADDGYVSRVVVSPWGFGRAIYVTHPATGLTTVYGHLESFADKIDTPVRSRQYENETFNIDTEFAVGELPVKKGEMIGISGNAGSSGGPHLHMDVRDTRSGDALDPMPYFKDRIKDGVAPEVRQIAVYPKSDGHVVTAKGRAAYRTPAELGQPVKAWGRVVPGIKAYDRMTGTSNIYGVKYLTLKVDGREVYRRTIDRVDFNHTRGVNTLVDCSDRYRNGAWVMVTAVPEAAPLGDMIRTELPGGVLTIDEERDYKCEFILEDEHGNRSSARFVIRGERCPLKKDRPEGTLFRHDGDNGYSADGVSVTFPSGTFYDDLYFSVSSGDGSQPASPYKSCVYTIGDPSVPLAGNYELSIDLATDDMPDKSKYCLVRVRNGKRSAVSARYDNGRMVARTNQLGSYQVTVDTVAPKVVPQGKAQWGKSGKVTYSISDNLSGVESYRGEIDGRFMLFELDGKTGRVSFRLDPARVTKGKRHIVKMTVTDACGNTNSVTDTFTW